MLVKARAGHVVEKPAPVVVTLPTFSLVVIMGEDLPESLPETT